METDTKLDPPSNTAQTDRVAKLRNQQERQTLVALLSKDVTGLLQRTRLQVSVTCQAWHAKNSRHMLLGMHTSISLLHAQLTYCEKQTLSTITSP